MNRNFSLLILKTLVILFPFACISKKDPSLEITAARKEQMKKMEWLLGSWNNNSSNGNFYETWKRENDTTFRGNGFSISGRDTLFQEQLSLEWVNDTLCYIPAVKNQNNDLPVHFKLITVRNNTYVFENKEHDFPQRITYKYIEPDSLYAKIEGLQNGNFRLEQFPLKKLK